MNPVVRNIGAALLGLFVGGLVNMGLIILGGALIPAPAGTDTSTPEGLNAAIPLFEPKHYLFPFLAHALGTLSGAWLATMLATGRKLIPAMIIGVFFLAGGTAMVFQLPAPWWFEAGDLLFAYLPMAWLGFKLANRGAR